MSNISTAAPSALDAQMKRTTAREMFRLAAAYFRSDSVNASGHELFVLLPRFNACVRLSPDAVRLYFDHVHAHRSWRARAFRAALMVLARGPKALAGLVPSLPLYKPQEAYPSTDWSAIDVLLAEWQFVGAFSGAHQSVSHILTDAQYERCFENEMGARNEMRPFVPMPRTVRIERGESRGWTEQFFPNDASLSERQRPFSDLQTAMCHAYVETGETISVTAHLAHLRARIDRSYLPGVNDPIADRLRKLLEWTRAQAAREGIESLRLARGHGDFNPGQVLSAGGNHVLIDWSESERGVVFHDYVQSALWFYGWRDLAAPVDVPALYTMRDGLSDELDRLSPLLAVALVLVEVGAKQHMDYTQRRGTFRSWMALASETLTLAGASGADQPATVPSLRDDSHVQS